MIIKKRNELIKEMKNESKTFKTQNEEETTTLFDIDNIDFSQRSERRRGDRRRGYRRIDDRNLVSRAQEEASTIRDSAAKEGYAQGIAQAQEDIKNIKNAIVEFLKAKQDVFEYIAPDILEISVDIAGKIVKKEINQDPQIILNNILDVLKTISKDESKITIKLNPQQADTVKSALPEILNETGIDARIIIMPDSSIDIGSCIVTTNNGIVDATVETQLEIIKEAFKGI